MDTTYIVLHKKIPLFWTGVPGCIEVVVKTKVSIYSHSKYKFFVFFFFFPKHVYINCYQVESTSGLI